MTPDQPPSKNPKQDALERFVAATSDGAGSPVISEASSDDREIEREIERLSAIAKEAGGLRQAYAGEIDALKRRGARRRAVRRTGGGALVLALAVAGAIAAFGWRSVEAVAGKPVTFDFLDGSRVHLDAGGALEVPIAPWRRQARLLAGDAVFDIVHDPSRSFAVHTPVSTLTDLGTRFLVRANRNEVEVAVFEGKVEIGSRTGHHMVLVTGRAARANAQGIANLSMPDEGEAAAWRLGRLVFRDTPLDQVALRLSRYRQQPVILGAASLSGLKVSGSFRLDDTEGVLRALEVALPVRISDRNGTAMIEPLPRKR